MEPEQQGSSPELEPVSDGIVLSNAKDWDEVFAQGEVHIDDYVGDRFIPKPGMKLEFIDESMANELVEYGKKHAKLNRNQHVAAFLIGALFLGFIPAFFSFNIWPFFLVAAGIATIYGSMLASQVSDAFNNRQYRIVAKLMDNALWWNQLCSPLSILPYLTLAGIQARLLLLQGRYMEMEALLLICRGSIEKSVDLSSVPANERVANDLACTYIGQERYEEAERILKTLVYGKKSAGYKRYSIVNLALCYVKMNRPDDATSVLDANQALMRKADKLVSIRTQLIRALIDVKAKKFETVDERLEELIPAARIQNESNEFIANCYIALAEVRSLQGRIDEAHLHYRTAIDLFKSNDNPSYWSLAQALREYADMLEREGEVVEAKSQRKLAERYELAYCEREMARMIYLRYRVTQEKPVQLITSLVNVDGFPPLSIEKFPPGLEDDSKGEDHDTNSEDGST
jgi:tetratricopeptide (TPR) repeat protein